MKTKSNISKLAAAGMSLFVLCAWAHRAHAGSDGPTSYKFTAAPVEAVYKALAREIARNKGKLHIAGEQKPYFTGLQVSDRAGRSITYSLGAFMGKWKYRSRNLKGTIKVGNYKFDNTGYYSTHSWGSSRSVPFEHNGLSLRRAAYYTFDRAYKNAVRQYSRKKAGLQNQPQQDIPDSWTKVPAVKHYRKLAPITYNLTPWHGPLRKTSAVFRKFPSIHNSSVRIGAGARATHVLTSEGLRLFRSGFLMTVSMSASTQCKDGSNVRLAWSKMVRDPKKLPTPQKVLEKARKLAKKLTELAKAPKLKDDFSGPVMFEGKAAAETLAGILGVHLSANAPPLGWRRRAVFEKMIGRKILPNWLSVTDDPTLKKYKKKNLAGHYDIDDEGVKAKKIVLVKNGKLMGFLGSRRPSKDLKASNGHGRGVYGDPLSVVAMPSNLLILPRRPLSKVALKRKYIAMLRKEGLKFGFIVKMTQPASRFGGYGWGGRNLHLPRPILVYKVDLKGKETLVRGVKLGNLPASDLKRMVAMGGKPVVVNKWLGGSTGVSVVTYSVIFDRLQINPQRKAWSKPPILPSPLKGLPK